MNRFNYGSFPEQYTVVHGSQAALNMHVYGGILAGACCQ